MNHVLKKLALLIGFLFLCLSGFAHETNLDFLKSRLGSEVEVKGELFGKAVDQLKKYDAQVELVDPSADPRWNPGSSGRVVLEKNGIIKVLLPKKEKIRAEALMERVFEAADLQQKVKEFGKESMVRVFERAPLGDKQARALLLDMEIKAREQVLSNLKRGETTYTTTNQEFSRLLESREKLYDRTSDYKKLLDKKDYHSVGRKLEDYLREKDTLVDKSLGQSIEEAVKSLKYGNPSPKAEWKKIEDNLRSGLEPFENFAGPETSPNIYNVGPDASPSLVEEFKKRISQYGAKVEFVERGDPRLPKDSQSRTYVAEDGTIKVLLRGKGSIKKYALVDELTHVIQFKNMGKEYGTTTLAEMFKAGFVDVYFTLDLMNGWEIKAKKEILQTLNKKDPNRKLLEGSIDKLKNQADPLLKCRKTNGRLDWKKVNARFKEETVGAANYILALFLKELAVAIKSRDRFVIEEFFEGLLTTDFFVDYGLYTVGTVATEIVYSKFIQKFIKPRFVNNLFKSSLAVAVGIALPDLVKGQFDGKVFAINATGLFLSSAAVKAGLAGIKWAIPLGKIASKAPWLSKIMTAYEATKWAKMGAWVYSAAEAAVVIYFGEKISDAITDYVNEKEVKKKVGEASEAFIEAVKSGNKDKVKEASKNLEGAYNDYRNFLYKPLEEEEMKLMSRLNKMGRERKGLEDAYKSYMDLYGSDPAKYASLKRLAENLKEGKMKSLEKDMEDAFGIYERNKKGLMKDIYLSHVRNSSLVDSDMDTLDAVMGRTGDGSLGLLDRATNWWKARSVKKAFYSPSSNRLESYADEADVLNLALAMGGNSDVRGLLRLRRDEIKLLADADKSLFEAASGESTTSTGSPGGPLPTGSDVDTEGLLKRLHRMGR